MAWILTVSCVCWSTRAWLARSLGWREPRSKSSGRCVDTMDSDTLFAVSKEFTDLNVWVMYTMHSHSTLCRCQFFSCNTNTLLEITGLSPAGGIQTAYNLSIVNLLFCIICLNVVYPGILDVPRRLENTPKITSFWFNVWNAVLKFCFFHSRIICYIMLRLSFFLCPLCVPLSYMPSEHKDQHQAVSGVLSSVNRPGGAGRW